jgi:hypothetical protein
MIDRDAHPEPMWKMLAMAAALWAAIILALSGCAGQQQAPPGMPTIAAIEAQAAAFDAIPPATVPAFYVAGLTMAELNCGGYFDQATLNALQQAQTAGSANILAGTVLSVLGLAGVGGPAVAGVGAGASALQALLQNNLQNTLAGSDPAAVATLVIAAQATLENATPAPVTAADAYRAIYGIYRACSPAGIQGLKEAALAAAPNHLAVTGGSAPTIGGLQAPRKALPTVTVR